MRRANAASNGTVAASAFKRASMRLLRGTSALNARSWSSSNFAQLQPCPSSPTRWATGTRTLSKNISFRLCAPSIEMIGRIVMPGERASISKKLMPRCGFASGSVRTRQNSQSA